MKVLVFTTEFSRLNGAERLSVELAEALNTRDGIESSLASMYSCELPEVRRVDESLRRRGIGQIHYLGLKAHPKPWSVVRAIWTLRRLLKREAYDIVESSLITPTVLASWASWGLKTKHVAGIHNAYSRKRFNRPRHRVWRLSVRGGRCACFYAISEFVRTHWVEFSKTPPEKSHTVYNGISNEFFEVIPHRERLRDELGVPRDACLILFVGRLMMRKGIDIVVDALGPILEERNLYIVYVGEWYASEGLFPDEDNLQGNLQRRIADAGWENRMMFLGRRSDIPHLMASSDLLVHPARLEGFGLILAEAMATGLPVVASNVEGIPEVLAGTESIMVPPDDPNALRMAVLETLDWTSTEASLAIEKGRQRAEDFRMENRVNGLVQLFHNVLMR